MWITYSEYFNVERDVNIMRIVLMQYFLRYEYKKSIKNQEILLIIFSKNYTKGGP
jgi:hypothetical protein